MSWSAAESVIFLRQPGTWGALALAWSSYSSKDLNQGIYAVVVGHWTCSGKTAAMVAEELGLHTWNVRDWKRRYHSAFKPVEMAKPTMQWN